MNIKYETDCFPKLFPGRKQSFSWLKIFIPENDSSGITDIFGL